MERLRCIVRSALHRVDELYRLRHRLEPVGPVLFVGRARYDGPAKEFPDGTQLRPGDALGTLHFNNARIAALDAGTPTAIAFSFLRLLLESLRTLAELAREGAPFGDLAVFQGIGWWRQGEKVGFISEPFPEGRRKRFLAVHIGLLVWAFAPPASTAIAARPEPRISWITRATLLKRYGSVEQARQEVVDAPAGARAG
jgi:hypothetical protein